MFKIKAKTGCIRGSIPFGKYACTSPSRFAPASYLEKVLFEPPIFLSLRADAGQNFVGGLIMTSRRKKATSIRGVLSFLLCCGGNVRLISGAYSKNMGEHQR